MIITQTCGTSRGPSTNISHEVDIFNNPNGEESGYNEAKKSPCSTFLKLPIKEIEHQNEEVYDQEISREIETQKLTVIFTLNLRNRLQ